MKNVITSIAIAAFAVAGLQAQENKTLKKESTITREITKEGNKIKVKEVKSTDTERGEIIVEGTKKTNQNFKESTSKDLSADKVLVNEAAIDKKNEAAIKAQKEKQQAALEQSKRKQAALAEKRKKENEMKALKKKKELAERQAELEARPKGMNKLKKD
ncbi:hypothetical protein [Aequorivita marina]|uniref:hypothetical protein n=1 Tax=Aequorivita marina TaxID=3073654 RepID=UPI002874045F|nr:hypothetical protein [Aequorivita sp. S2608]MDS1297621.1 hypothetical protein [Aequorivita sp. S2608]